MRSPLRSVLVMLGLVSLGLAGCDVIDDATAPIDRGTLVDDMSKQLERGENVLYQADYQLAGGSRGSIGQEISPHRTVYGYPGGMLIVSAAEQTQCDTQVRPPKCQLRTMVSTGSGLPSTLAEATKRGLMTGPVVADLLRVASLQPNSKVLPRETTIAGQNASCLEISGLVDSPASAFAVCVTTDGVLASFTGLVNGLNLDQALIQVSRKVGTDAFKLPDGAQVVDLRQVASPASIG